MSHTILLVQPTPRPESRTWSDYETVGECMEGICKIFEEHLKKQNPSSASITYDVSQLFDFIDRLSDLSCLCYQKHSGAYAPHNKDWMKRRERSVETKPSGQGSGRQKEVVSERDGASSNESSPCSSGNLKSQQCDEQTTLREKAKAALLFEANRGSQRSETLGPQGWLRPATTFTNKRFLSRAIAATLPKRKREEPSGKEVESSNCYNRTEAGEDLKKRKLTHARR